MLINFLSVNRVNTEIKTLLDMDINPDFYKHFALFEVDWTSGKIPVKTFIICLYTDYYCSQTITTDRSVT